MKHKSRPTRHKSELDFGLRTFRTSDFIRSRACVDLLVEKRAMVGGWKMKMAAHTCNACLRGGTGARCVERWGLKCSQQRGGRQRKWGGCERGELKRRWWQRRWCWQQQGDLPALSRLLLLSQDLFPTPLEVEGVGERVSLCIPGRCHRQDKRDVGDCQEERANKVPPPPPPTTTAKKRSETPKPGRPRTPVWRAYGLFSPVSTATPPLCVGDYRWLCIQRLVRYAPVAARNRAPSRNSNPALDLVNSHSILQFRNSHVILSKHSFYLFHAYARNNNMWILDQPLSPQLPDLLLDLMFMRSRCSSQACA